MTERSGSLKTTSRRHQSQVSSAAVACRRARGRGWEGGLLIVSIYLPTYLRSLTSLTEYEEHLLEALEQKEVDDAGSAPGGGDGIACTAEKLDQVKCIPTLVSPPS